MSVRRKNNEEKNVNQISINRRNIPTGNQPFNHARSTRFLFVDFLLDLSQTAVLKFRKWNHMQILCSFHFSFFGQLKQTPTPQERHAFMQNSYRILCLIFFLHEVFVYIFRGETRTDGAKSHQLRQNVPVFCRNFNLFSLCTAKTVALFANMHFNVAKRM